MQTKKQKLKQEKNKNHKLMKMIADEREKVKGYEQLAKVHSAYIAILLKRLGATREKPLTITSEETKEAIMNYEARALIENGDYNLWCEVVE